MTENAPEWNPQLVPDSPLFDDLRTLFSRLPARWPRPRSLDRLLRRGLPSGGGARLRFSPQNTPLGALEYERQIYETGRIPTRPRNWHDLFNALMWAAFGISKTRLNAIQVAEGTASTANRRSSRRDLATLIDECGVVVASADADFEALHRAHRWAEMFQRRRDGWGRRIGAAIIGHGLYQQCLQPYSGLTGKAVYVRVDAAFFGLPLHTRYRHLDRLLAARLETGAGLATPRDLLPLPILGIPGWHAANRDPRYYANEAYFRPQRPARAQAEANSSSKKSVAYRQDRRSARGS